MTNMVHSNLIFGKSKMGEVLTAHKYRFYPTKGQQEQLAKTFGCCRFVYNHFLGKKITLWKEEKKSLYYKECSSMLAALKEEFTWLKEVSSVCLQQSLRHLEDAYKNFFGSKTGFPTFKKRVNSQSAHYMKNAFQISGNKVLLAKQKEPLDIRFSRHLEGDPTSITITKESNGRYFISFCFKKVVEELPKNGKAIGIDLGISSFLTDNDGNKLESPLFFSKDLKNIRKAQKKLSKKRKGSSNWRKAQVRVAQKHAVVRDKRNDFLHKLSSQFVHENQVIAVENLNVKKMMKNKNLSRSIADSAWNTFLRFLEYKSGWYGRIFVKIEMFYPSSKTCNDCKSVKEDLQLSDREWICEKCGVLHDRDTNAAENILEEGLKLVPWGSRDLKPAELM